MMGTLFKFIHCSDLHLDTPFKRISVHDPELGRRMIDSAFVALDRIIDKAINENVDFILFVGDIFDRETNTPMSRHRFAKAMERSRIPCYIAYGNHDFERKWEKSIPFPENAHVFPDNVERIPFFKGEHLADILGISHSVKDEGRDLTAEMEGSSVFTIAAVHCDLDAASEGKRYAPCRLNDILNKKVDYWALGHIHKRNIIHQFPHVVYPGNTQGRSSKETGEKGAYLVTVEDGKVKDMEFFVTGPIEWIEINADITGKDMNGLIDTISQRTSGSLIKLRISGHGELDRMIRLEQDGFIDVIERNTGCKVVSLEIMSTPDMDINERRNTGDFISAVISETDRLFGMSRSELISMICNTKTSAVVKDVFEDMSDEELNAIIADARNTLLERLTGDDI